MTDREIRKVKRLQTFKVNTMSLHSDNNHSFHIGLSPMKSWELLAQISQNSWFLETGTKVLNRLDKTQVKIFTRI